MKNGEFRNISQIVFLANNNEVKKETRFAYRFSLFGPANASLSRLCPPPSYDRAITVFSPDGHLFQVEYALEAVKRGLTTVALKTPGCVIMGVEKRKVPKLQGEGGRKINQIDEHLWAVSTGLTADARVLIDMARVEAQSYRLTCEDPPTAGYISRYVSSVQQRYTQRGGVRPFGITSMICGFDDGAPKLYMCDPAGTCSEWKANAVGGRNDKSVREYLEKNYAPGMTEEEGLKLCVSSMLEVVDGGSGNMEVCVVKVVGGKVTCETVEPGKVKDIVDVVESEKEEGKEEQ